MTDKAKAFLQRIVSECNQITVTGIDNACHIVNIKLFCDQIAREFDAERNAEKPEEGEMNGD